MPIILIYLLSSGCTGDEVAQRDVVSQSSQPDKTQSTPTIAIIRLAEAEAPTATFTPDLPLRPPATATATVTNSSTPTSTPLAANTPPLMATIALNTAQPPEPTLEPAATQTPVSVRTVRVGLHGRNDVTFHELDYQLIREAKIETLKMMSLTSPDVFARIRTENPDIEFIVRLYDDRINSQGHPTPEAFAQKMIPIIGLLQPYTTKFEIGNEPNHFQRYEGWGPEDTDALSFNAWFQSVYDLLKQAHPWAEFGFPALGTPNEVHRDRAWLEINQAAINKADWLGVHCYWQTPPNLDQNSGQNSNETSTMFDEDHGLCFKYYHAQFPDKAIELTEFDNDNVVYDLPPLSEEEIANEYVTYYQTLFNYPYIRSASSFIMSSPNSQNWEHFVWRTEAGHFKPVVAAIANMPRPPLAE